MVSEDGTVSVGVESGYDPLRQCMLYTHDLDVYTLVTDWMAAGKWIEVKAPDGDYLRFKPAAPAGRYWTSEVFRGFDVASYQYLENVIEDVTNFVVCKPEVSFYELS